MERAGALVQAAPVQVSLPRIAYVYRLGFRLPDGRDLRDGTRHPDGGARGVDGGVAEGARLEHPHEPGEHRGRHLLREGGQLLEAAIDLGVSLIGQIHSHGPGYGVDLSPTDRMYGVAVPYYLSLVAPDYAVRPYTPLTECGVHVLQPGRGFRRLTTREINSRFELTQGKLPPLIVIGESQYG